MQIDKTKKYIIDIVSIHNMETVTISKKEYESLKQEIESLRNSSLYKRLLEFEKNIIQKKFTRQDIGF